MRQNSHHRPLLRYMIFRKHLRQNCRACAIATKLEFPDLTSVLRWPLSLSKLGREQVHTGVMWQRQRYLDCWKRNWNEVLRPIGGPCTGAVGPRFLLLQDSDGSDVAEMFHRWWGHQWCWLSCSSHRLGSNRAPRRHHLWSCRICTRHVAPHTV